MHRLVPALAVMVLSTTAACGTEDDPAPRVHGIEAYAESVTIALAELPYAESRGRTQVIVQAGDLEKATELAGLQRPGQDPAQRGEWLRALDGELAIPPAESVALRSMLAEREDRLGFTATDVRFFAEVRDGLDRFAVQHLYDDAQVSDDLPTTDGLHATGKGRVGSFDREAGLSGRFPRVNVLAEDGHHVAFSTDASKIADWQAGRGKRLDQNQKLRDLADDLDSRGIYASYLVEGSFDQFRGHPPEDAVKEEFDAVGLGLHVGADRVPMVYVNYWFPRHVERGGDQVVAMWQHAVSRRTNQPLADVAKLVNRSTVDHVVRVGLDVSATGPAAVVEMLRAADTPFQGE